MMIQTMTVKRMNATNGVVMIIMEMVIVTALMIVTALICLVINTALHKGIVLSIVMDIVLQMIAVRVMAIVIVVLNALKVCIVAKI
jgi:hypothetical protein